MFIMKIKEALKLVAATETLIMDALENEGIFQSTHDYNFDWSEEGVDVELIHEYQGGQDTYFTMSFTVSDLESSETIMAAIERRVKSDREREEAKLKAQEVKDEAARRAKWEELNAEFGS